MVATETKATHTPGPWRVSNVSTRGIPQLKVETSESGRWDRVDIAKLNVSNKESEANARLIAAAPDLLQALEAVSEWLANGSCYVEVEDSDMVNDAIRKARG